MPLTVEQLTERVTSSGVLSNEQLSEFLAGLPADARARSDAEALARELVKQKKLTKFQAEQIYAGKGASLSLGNYLVLDKLGEGGMGMVLKALHRRMERIVALKVMSSTAVKSPDAFQRFQREAKAAAKLNHPNIVTAHDADEAKGTHFLVMEYVEGDDLRALVKQHGPLPVEQAVRCIIQAARGLEFAHERGVIHRDIKPANLLIDAKGAVKILDMGLARIDGAVGESSDGSELTSTGAILGTVDYMAPEQAMNSKHADARSDIYSLGCSLYYLLTGKAVYDGETAMSKLMAHQHAPIPSLVEEQRRLGLRPDPDLAAAGRDGVPTYARIDPIFQRMVAKRPEDRPLSMTEVIAELERCVFRDSQSIGSATVTFVRPASGGSREASPQDQNDVSGELPINTASDGPSAVVATASSQFTQETDLEFAETSIWPPIDAHPDPQASRAKEWTIRTKRQRVVAASLLACLILVALAIRFTPNSIWHGSPDPAAPSENDPVLDKIDFDAERAAAEQLLKLNKGKTYLANDKTSWEMESPLPQEPFYVSDVGFVEADITDEEIAVLAGCRGILKLDVRSNAQLTATGLKSVGPLPRLETLKLDETGCARESLEFLSKYPRLNTLALSGDSREGIMQTLPPCPRLASLTTPYRRGSVGDEGLQTIVRHCPQLTDLALNDSQELSLVPLAQLRSLQKLHCWGSHLNEVGIGTLAELPSLYSLGIDVPERKSMQWFGKLNQKLRELLMRDQDGSRPESLTDAADWLPVTRFANLEQLIILDLIAVDAASLQAVAAMPRLKKFSIYSNITAEDREKLRRYSAADIAAFHKARPDVQLNIDGQEYPAKK